MQNILILISNKQINYKMRYFDQLSGLLTGAGYNVSILYNIEEILLMVKSDQRIATIIFDWDEFQVNFTRSIANINENLPIVAISDQHNPLDMSLQNLKVNLEFLCYHLETVNDAYQKINIVINKYIESLLPPFTKALFNFADGHHDTFCTPGHLGGTAFLKTPVGTLFYDFYGENTFQADLSVSVEELGSLLDHSGPNLAAEKYAAKIFNSDRTFFVTNGTSTANKIVGMYAAAPGDTILVDRNCHKSITHLMMMVDVYPIYLKPTRNVYGIIGGISETELSTQSIDKKIKQAQGKAKWPSYVVITNSTYDGVFYNVEKIKQLLEIKHIHFDSAWVPYTNFHPIYQKKYGMYGKAVPGKTVYETQSTHKLLAAFSQASMIHIKGDYDFEVFNECFMMHSSTSPQYSIVASCEISAAIMQGKQGLRLMQDAIDEAINFRQEIKRLKDNVDDWFFDVWQPSAIGKPECWPLKPSERWHGFKEVDKDHLYLDPIKVTILTPGIQHNKLSADGISAFIVTKFLADHDIIVEKTGPYTMLFLFSIGVDRAKAMTLVKALVDFKRMYDEDLPVKTVLPGLYANHPDFYKNMSIQELAKKIQQLNIQYDLPVLMSDAYDTLPDMVITPHQAFKETIQGKSRKVLLRNVMGEISANMILPYPPGVPLIMPGERVTKAVKPILDYLLMLESMGKSLPGFEPDIHGTEADDENNLWVKVLDIDKTRT